MPHKKFCRICSKVFKGQKGTTLCPNCEIGEYNKFKKVKNMIKNQITAPELEPEITVAPEEKEDEEEKEEAPEAPKENEV